MTEDEVKRMKREGWNMLDQLISITCIKPLEVVTRTADVFVKFGHNDEARKLRGW